MTNEKLYKDEAEKIAKKNNMHHPAIYNGKPVSCIGFDCYKCDLHKPNTHRGCSEYYEEWLKSEAEPEKSKKTPPCIVVYRDGDTVTVKDLETGETASAVCSKKDTFDIHTGAFIAMSRLTGFDADIMLMRLEMERLERYISGIKMRLGTLMGEGYKYPDFDEEEEV